MLSKRLVCAKIPSRQGAVLYPRHLAWLRYDQLGIPCCTARSSSRTKIDMWTSGKPLRSPSPPCWPWAGRSALAPGRWRWLGVSTNLMNITTFILKNVMEVNRSTVAFRSCSFSGLLAGKLFLYMDRSIRRELWRVSSNLINLSF